LENPILDFPATSAFPHGNFSRSTYPFPEIANSKGTPREGFHMLEIWVEAILVILIPLCELIGICVVGISALRSFWRYLCGLATQTTGNLKYQLADGLALSLEFKMAAEILKTVQIHALDELAVLGVVIGLRALLSFLIHFEMKPQPH